MLGAFMSAIRFFWTATAGNRLRPWRSEYLRWRMETFTGQRAETIMPKDFWRLAVAERRQMYRFFQWMNQMERVSHGKKP